MPDERHRGFTLVDSPAEGTPEAQAEGASEIPFSSFVLSLATSAFAHLGRAPAPADREGEPPAPDLPLAHQTIGLLEMLERKTRGNLEREEEQLLSGLLHELHLAYVEVHGQHGSD